MDKYICIHGHFYQPPRENPWLEFVELQETAHPYHDWNEKITAECYAPNGASRILDGQGRIARIVNNYAKISFNFGPTLLSWLEQRAPDVYRSILEGDRQSRRTFSGHGSALAQAYHHLIMPLANKRDKYTQLYWGIKDFECRFQRKPEGMWLPETAVDLETLEIMSELGITFTILAPHQARRVRRIGKNDWQDVDGGKIDTTRAYELALPSGRKVNLFFFNGPISRAVAFGNLLSKAENLVHRLMEAFSPEQSPPQLISIAADGETFGHHRRFADMALAYALSSLESSQAARFTNYGQYLERFPASHQVEILENTSWSCGHGIERWRSDCGCNSGAQPNWNQAWREPLREALDWLRDKLERLYEARAGRLLKDPWVARNGYVEILFDRSPDKIALFLSEQATPDLSQAETVIVLKLLELQRHAMLMFTSCGWFHDDISGLESIQILQYAGRAIQLAEELFNESYEPHFLRMLEQARSNNSEYRDGRILYERFVKPALIDHARAGVHYAVGCLFQDYSERTRVYCYTMEQEDFKLLSSGKTRIVLGRVKITSDITRESTRVGFGVSHSGNHNIRGGIQKLQSEESYRHLVQEISETLAQSDVSGSVRILDQHFGSGEDVWKLLCRDDQRKFLEHILDSALSESENLCGRLHEQYAPLFHYLSETGIPLPRGLYPVVGVATNGYLRKALQQKEPDIVYVKSLLKTAEMTGVKLDGKTLGDELQHSIERHFLLLRSRPDNIGILKTLNDLVELTGLPLFEVNLWKAQNIHYGVLEEAFPRFRERKNQGEKNVEEWLNLFTTIGARLSFSGGQRVMS
ncbi:MAG: glycoside hydrolase [candidate division Zixibacteria bacterium RBG_16_50_21]|nr:MAG: glycoside hydrolase [candidate division Zixibacteria bacterium RBG_16_50_21]